MRYAKIFAKLFAFAPGGGWGGDRWGVVGLASICKEKLADTPLAILCWVIL